MSDARAELDTIRTRASIAEAARQAAEARASQATVFGHQWRTAAMVYAWTEEAPGRRTDLAGKSARLTLKQFAALGIRGLADRATVAKYRAANAARSEKAKAGKVGRAAAIDKNTCDVCRERFSVPVWHCPVCAHHWHKEFDSECKNCRSAGVVPVTRNPFSEHTNSVRTESRKSTNRGSKAKAAQAGTNRGAVQRRSSHAWRRHRHSGKNSGRFPALPRTRGGDWVTGEVGKFADLSALARVAATRRASFLVLLKTIRPRTRGGDAERYFPAAGSNYPPSHAWRRRRKILPGGGK